MDKNVHNIDVGSNIKRSNERIDLTGEVFTPLDCCYEMIDEIPLHILKNKDSTILDNCAGCGNFLIALKNRLMKYHSEDHILNNMLYGIELMKDNHKEMCDNLGVDLDHPHYICGDALTYDYSFGQAVGVEAFMTE